ncbi:MFS transporter [Peribacillus frigoritolerans]|nr:MFS transporter [Peribacillus frigoritolerans]
MFNEQTTADEKRNLNGKFVILSYSYYGYVGCFLFLDRMVITIALPYIGEDLNLTATAQGLLLSIFFAGYALFQIPGGMLSDKFGFRRVMSIAIVWWSIFTSLTGFIFFLSTYVTYSIRFRFR